MGLFEMNKQIGLFKMNKQMGHWKIKNKIGCFKFVQTGVTYQGMHEAFEKLCRRIA